MVYKIPLHSLFHIISKSTLKWKQKSNYDCTHFIGSTIKSPFCYYKKGGWPWLVWLSCLDHCPVHWRWRIQFPVRAHIQVSDSIPHQDWYRRQTIDVSLILLFLSQCPSSYKTTMIKTVGYWRKDKHTQENRTESRNRSTHKWSIDFW